MSNLPASPVPGAVAHPDADNPTGADSSSGPAWCIVMLQPADPPAGVEPARSYLGRIRASAPVEALRRWVAHPTAVRRYLDCLSPARPASNKGTIDWEIPPYGPGRFEGDPADYVFAEAITTDDVLIHVLLNVVAVDPE